jgi:predicted CopG family antitoxin
MTRFPKSDLSENFIFRLSEKQKNNLMLLAEKKYKGSASEAIRALIEEACREL